MFWGIEIKSKIKLSVGAVTDKGLHRKENEDSILADEENRVFVIADGAGGYEHGKFSSEFAVSKVRANINKPLDLLIQEIHSELKEEIDKGATTFTGAKIDGKELQISHVGDSKIYLITNNTITQLTEDHNLITQFIKDSGKSVEEAFDSLKKKKRNPHALYQALGPSHEGEINDDDIFSTQIKLKPGYKILLCSDGLTNMIIDDDFCTDTAKIREVVKEYENPQEACEKLVELANAGGGKDNISAILIKVEKEKKARNFAISAASIAAILCAAGLFIYHKKEQPIISERPETRAEAPTAVIEKEKIEGIKEQEKKAPEAPTEAKRAEVTAKPSFELSEGVNFRTRRIGPTSSILSGLRDFKVIESTNDYDIINFRIDVKGNAENAYAFFDYDTKIVYKSEIKDGNAVFTVKRPKNVGRLNVIAAIGEDNAIRWTSSWKYRGIEGKINSELSKAKKSGKTEGGSYSPQNTIEGMKKASNGYDLDKLLESYSRATFQDVNDVKANGIDKFNTHIEEIVNHYNSCGQKQTLDTFALLGDSKETLYNVLNYARKTGVKVKTNLSLLSDPELVNILDIYSSNSNRDAIDEIERLTGMRLSTGSLYRAVDMASKHIGIESYRKSRANKTHKLIT